MLDRDCLVPTLCISNFGSEALDLGFVVLLRLNIVFEFLILSRSFSSSAWRLAVEETWLTGAGLRKRVSSKVMPSRILGENRVYLLSSQKQQWNTSFAAWRASYWRIGVLVCTALFPTL